LQLTPEGEEKLEELIEAFEENEDVVGVYVNAA
jgi:transcriptional/translational regulatory protein YebC/TACO1